MDIHLVRVPQDVDVVNVRRKQRNEENVPHFFLYMLTAMLLVRKLLHTIHHAAPPKLPNATKNVTGWIQENRSEPSPFFGWVKLTRHID